MKFHKRKIFVVSLTLTRECGSLVAMLRHYHHLKLYILLLKTIIVKSLSTCIHVNRLFFPDSYGDYKSDDERKKRPRTAFTAAQIKSLEAEFEKNKYLSVAKRCQLSKTLKLTETQVRTLEIAIYHVAKGSEH